MTGIMNDPLLQVEDLHIHFQTDDGLIKAVNGVDYDIMKGETLGLVGESGSGKSVSALSIMGLIPQPPGRILKGCINFDGQDLLRLPHSKIRKVRGNAISMIFQEPMTSLNPVHRIGHQVSEVIQLHRPDEKQQAWERAISMLGKVGIADPKRRARDYPFQLSGGMRQRVMIAMALACNPKLIIADEPTTALDVTIQAQILELMLKLQNEFKSSILLITHDLGVVAETAKWVAVMYAGQVVEYAEVREIFHNPQHPYTVALLESIPHMDRPPPPDKILRAIPGTVPSLLDLPPGCPFQDRCLKVFDQCRQENPPLFHLKGERKVRCWLYG